MKDRDLRVLMNEWKEFLSEINPYHKEDGTWGSKKNSSTYSLTKNAMDDIKKDSDVEVPARGKVTKKGKISSKFGMNSGDDKKQCGRLNIDGHKKPKTRSCKDYPKHYDESLLVAPPGAHQIEPSQDTPQSTKRPRKAIRVRISKRKERLDDDQGREVSKKRKREKILPGYGDLQSLSRGITEQRDFEISLVELVDGLRAAYKKGSPATKREIEKKMASAGFYSGSMIDEKCRSMGRLSIQDWMKVTNSQALAQKGELFKKEKAK